MTTPNHATQSFLIGYIIYPNTVFALTCAILGAFPDIVQIQGLWNKELRWNGWYAIWHNLDGSHKWVYFVPFANLHIWEDSYLHKKEGGVNKYYLWAEFITWALMIYPLMRIFL